MRGRKLNGARGWSSRHGTHRALREDRPAHTDHEVSLPPYTAPPAAHARRTVLVGCSFTGLALLHGLARARGRFRPGEVTVVEPRPDHTYRPLAHEALGDGQSLDALRLPLAPHLDALGAQWHAVAATRVDAAQKVVHLANGLVVPYDRLVLATGGARDVPAALEGDGRVMPARVVEDALALRQRLRVLHATRSGMVRVVVVGGGLSGVEWGAALACTRIAGARVTVTIVERAERILPGVHAAPARRVRRVLGELGVEVLVGRAVRRLDGDRLLLDESIALPFDVAVWAAGVRPSPLVATLALPCAPSGQISVTPYLDVATAPGMYAAGEAARIVDERGEPRDVERRADDAIRQGAYLARRFVEPLPAGLGTPYRAAPAVPCAISLGPRRGIVFYGATSVELRMVGPARRLAAAMYLARLQRAAARAARGGTARGGTARGGTARGADADAPRAGG